MDNTKVFKRIAEALLVEYTSVYYVDAITNEYQWYSSNPEFRSLKLEPIGKDFFANMTKDALSVVHPDDQHLFTEDIKKETLLKELKDGSMQSFNYRLMIDGKPVYHMLKLIRGGEMGDDYFILGVKNIDHDIRKEKRQENNLRHANELARKDGLTGVKNKNAYKEMTEQLNDRMTDPLNELSFAVLVCDLNDLKTINDTRGHNVGDEYIQKASSLICDTFLHSPVYRIGGDEFVTLLFDKDLEERTSLVEHLKNQVIINGKTRTGPIIACGLSLYDPNTDNCYEDVFERADLAMYANKNVLKSLRRQDNISRNREISPITDARKRRLDSLFDAMCTVSGEGYVFACDMDHDYSRWSVQAVEDFNLPDTYLYRAGDIWEQFVHPEDKQIYHDAVDLMFSGEGILKKIRYRARRADGEYITCSTKAFVLSDENGQPEYFGGVVQSDSVLRKDHFFTDPVTGLPNINYLNEYGADAASNIRMNGKTPMLIYFDMNSMQYYNNQYGYSRGDELLRLTSDILTKVFKDAFLCRGADDHFIIIDEYSDDTRITVMIDRANDMIKAGAYGKTTGFQAGVCKFDEDTTTGEAIDHAKHALKWIGLDLNSITHFYSENIDTEYKNQSYIIEMFDNALKSGWIKLYYHGIVRLETGKGAAFEGLARWDDPERGLISPAQFIPALRKYHLTYKLDLYMFEQVCKEIPLRLEAGFPLVPVSINFSAVDFDYINIPDELDRIFDEYDISQYGIGRDYFIVEVTEEAMAMGPEHFYDQLRELRRRGYRIWLDDFGSGYSSLNVFSRLEIDLIKFDMELLRNLDRNGGVNRDIIRSMIAIAKKFHVHTLAEGMETAEQKRFLQDAGCELGQGFGFHKPEPLDAIIERSSRDITIIKGCETDEERIEMINKWNK